jgi:hypothetical protein
VRSEISHPKYRLTYFCQASSGALPHAGRVQIKIQVEGGEVHAKVWASEASALPLLQGHKAFLEVSLQNQGLTLGSFDLQHGQKGNETPTPAPQPAPTVAQAAGEPGQESPTAPAPLTANPHRIEIVA